MVLVALVAALISMVLVGGARSVSEVPGLIAFTRSDGIYVIHGDGTDARPLRKGPVASKAFGLDWSPDGRKLAFGAGGGLWVMDADGKNLTRLVAPLDVDGWEGGVGIPSWSPDGRRIAFSIGIKCCSGSRDAKVKGIWVVNADGSNLRRLLRLPDLGPDRGVNDPDWGPDGRRFAFTSYSGWIGWVYVVNSDGSDLRRLTGNEKGVPMAESPHWSVDGQRIVFVQTPQPATHVGPNTSEIYVMTVDSGAQVRLTRNGVADSTPVWSPDGRRIAFVRGEDCPSCPPSPGSEILAMNADGTGVKRLTHNRVGEGSPAWRSIAAPGA